jgi:hypothetical protein
MTRSDKSNRLAVSWYISAKLGRQCGSHRDAVISRPDGSRPVDS